MRGMFEIIKRMDNIEGSIKELKVDKGKLAEKLERMEKMVIGWGRKGRGKKEKWKAWRKDYGARKGG